MRILGFAQNISQILDCDGYAFSLFLHNHSGSLAASMTDNTLKLAHTRLPGIFGNYALQYACTKADLLGSKAIFFTLANHKIALSYFQLLIFCIAGKMYYLHSVNQWTRNRAHIISSDYPEHL